MSVLTIITKIPKPSRTLAKKCPFFPKRTRSGKRHFGQFSQTFWDCLNRWRGGAVQAQQRSYEIPKLSKTLADIQQTMHCSEPGPVITEHRVTSGWPKDGGHSGSMWLTTHRSEPGHRLPSNLTSILYGITHHSASLFCPFWNPLSAVFINNYHKIPKPSKTLAQKNFPFFPNVLGLERDTLVSFPKLSETASTPEKVVLCKCNRGATKFPNFQRPWLTYSRQCTILNQDQECLQI